MSKLGLGKGLSSLLGYNEGEIFGDTVKELTTINLTEIEVNPSQPRTHFDENSLMELSQSIKEHGVITPIIVRKLDETYQIIAGERRFRAAKLANLTEIPARIISANDKQVAEIALIENLQREDLNPLEEALGYKELMKKYSMTQSDISKSVGKSRSSIANTTRILVLCDDVLQMIKECTITIGHARAILSLNDTQKHLEFANYIAENSLSVRQAEKQAKVLNGEAVAEDLNLPEDCAVLNDFENRLQDSLCRKVKIVQNKNRKKGKIVLEYLNNEDLENLMEVLSNMKM